MADVRRMLSVLAKGLPIDPLPAAQGRDPNLAHAPVRRHKLDPQQKKLALRNALRYLPSRTHAELAPEFAQELEQYGHIYMYRFLPRFPIRAYPLDAYPARCRQAAAIMLMVCNNLDPAVAQFPQELVTYGGNGQVLCNWGQFWLLMRYLSEMTEEQTLVMYSGHPLGLFPSQAGSPRVVITNGMVIPNYSSKERYDDMFALGVSMYGQMTAGSYCYIGPQGIVHGTTITVLNAGRKYLGAEDLGGKVFLTSGLGGMSGAQAKAAVVAGCVGVVAEVSLEALEKRKKQGWIMEVQTDLEKLVQRIKEARKGREAVSIGFHGNVVTLWERLCQEPDRLVDLGSDQTSCHDVLGGGYCPVQLTYEQAREMLPRDPECFARLVRESLVRHAAAVNRMAARGMFFWDYGNAFLLEASRAGADVGHPEDKSGVRFRYPSYVQDIMGDIFSLGFGPFRWVCTSGLPADLDESDRLAAAEMEAILSEGGHCAEPAVAAQYRDNLRWILAARQHELVVGSQARILYSDRAGRVRIACAFNKAVREGRLKGPVVVSRDHHDVSGTDSPFRETSNIGDGSVFTADMAVQNCIGDAFRGATWVALHNGGGVGWGEVINGGFGLVLDGTPEAESRARLLLGWDVSNGVARRCWAGNAYAKMATEAAMAADPLLKVTLPHSTDDRLLDRVL